MGEARYYTKIFFDTPQDAQKAFPKIQKFFKQGFKAYDFWQKRQETENRDKLWDQIDKKFPEVGNYLRTVQYKNFNTGEFEIAYGNDPDNALAGLLDFGDKNEIKLMRVVDNAIWYSAYVWHFADWNPILNFIRKRYGALRTEWLSDEYIDPFDLLN